MLLQRAGTREVLEVTEESCILTVVVATGIYLCEKTAQKYTHTHIHKRVHVKLGNLNVLWGLYQCQFPGSAIILRLYEHSPWGELGEEHRGPLYCFCNFL